MYVFVHLPVPKSQCCLADVIDVSVEVNEIDDSGLEQVD